MDIYVCKLFLFCLIFFYTRQGRAAATPITFRYSRRSDVTIHKHAIPGKKLHGKKKMEKDYTSTRRTPRHSWKKKVHWGKKCKKTIHTRAVRLAIPGKQKVNGKKKEKRLYTHTRRTPRHSWKKKVHWEKKCKKTIHTHKPDI